MRLVSSVSCRQGIQHWKCRGSAVPSVRKRIIQTLTAKPNPSLKHLLRSPEELHKNQTFTRRGQLYAGARGLLAAALLKVVAEQIGSVIGGQIMLQKNLRKDLERMKMALESVEAVLGDAERRSITDRSICLWLKRLKVAMYAISDMIDEFEGDTQSITQPSNQKFSLTYYLAFMIPRLTIGPKVALANKMKTMRVDLDEITGQHKKFNLLASNNMTELKIPDERETSSNMYAQIFGRTKERDMILATLSKITTKEITILTIYGIGGLGKTTLAQMIYSSSQFKNYSRVWVYVSQTFELKKIGNSIISQLSEMESHYTEMQMIENSLSKLFDDKKILIVLDDLWEDKERELDKLMGMLNVGSGRNVVVIVTTCSEGIAMEVSTIKPHKLALLSNDMCWSIIKHKSAFKSRYDKNELKQIGKDIASKCGGVALAAQSLGYVLKSMTSRQWKLMRDSDIWSRSDTKNPAFTHVLASLRLSYSVMPPYLKLCFSYCAIFSKGHEIVKDDLIQQWLALAFIEPTDVYSFWELGEIYIRQLLGLSFLQNLDSPLVAGVHLQDATLFTMHDLVHDLARSVMFDEIIVAGKDNNNGGSYGRYALLSDCSKPLESSKIRALRFMDCGEIELDGAAFSSAKSLRILDLSECSIRKLPDSIGVLKQLRYLNAPRIQEATIPDSITRLSKLTYLNLRGSSAISALPESIGDIESLLYIDLSSCSGIEKLPESLGRLTKLVHLDLSNCFHVGDVSKLLGSLRELHYLNLSHCPNIGELPKELGGLSEMQYLNLSFSSYLQCCQEADVLGDLTKLQYLNLSSDDCSLRKLPEALGSFSELKYLNLSNCRQLEELPTLFGNLKNLVHLDLSNCLEVNGVPEALGGLINLQYLNLSRPCSRSHQTLTKLPEVIGNLSELRYLNLSGCLDSLPRNWDFAPLEAGNLIRSISALSNLEHLDLSNSLSVRSIPASFCNLKRLHTLDLSNCTFLKKIPESIGTIDSLKFLYVNSILEPPQLSSNAVSLPQFVVYPSDGDSRSNLVLLKHMDPVVLHITRLGNVKTAEEAQSIELIGKQSMKELELNWSKDAERFVDDKMLLEKLVPPSTLKKFVIRGYVSGSFPSWLMTITHYLPNLLKMEMCGLPKCSSLPPIDQLPKLIYLLLSDMPSLEEWNTSYSSGQECVIESLGIYDCPKLRIKQLPPRANLLTISNSDSVLSSLGEYTNACTSTSYPTYTTLHVRNSELPMHQWRLLEHLPGLSCLQITSCGDLTGSPGIIQHLTSLKSVHLAEGDLQELPKWLYELASLQSLILSFCDRITSLPHWLGELTSLKKLVMWKCDSIRSLPEGIQKLTNLQILTILNCPALKKWCELEENETKLAHIKDKHMQD